MLGKGVGWKKTRINLQMSVNKPWKHLVCTEAGQHVALVRTDTKQMNSFQQGFNISHWNQTQFMEWTFKKRHVFLKLLNMLLLQISKAFDLQPFPDMAFQTPWLERSKLRKKKKNMTKTKSRAFIPLPDVADGQAVGSSCLSPVWWCSWNVCWTHTGDSARTEPPACHMMLEGWSSATGTKRKKQTLKINSWWTS